MKIYEVGGAVRDRLLGRKPKDIDYVVVGATVEQMLALGFRQVGADFPVFLSPQTGDEYALARTERKSGAGYHGFLVDTENVTLEEDLGRRDLTINAMALDASERVVDPYGGRADLRDQVLRHVGPAFQDDPLRVLRVARFMARFGPGWVIAPETLSLLKAMVQADKLNELTRERVWLELHKGFEEVYPAAMLAVLADIGVLELPAFAEYARLATPSPWFALAQANSCSAEVKFGTATPRVWSKSEAKDSRVPSEFRQTAELMHLALLHEVSCFSSFDAPTKVRLLEQLGVLRGSSKRERLGEILQLVSSEAMDALEKSIAAVLSINQAEVVAGVTDARSIKQRISEARVAAVQAVES